jgi:hypothetical protein
MIIIRGKLKKLEEKTATSGTPSHMMSPTAEPEARIMSMRLYLKTAVTPVENPTGNQSNRKSHKFLQKLSLYQLQGPGQLTRYTDRLRDGRPRVRSSGFSLLHFVQTSSGAHPASYSMGTGGSFPKSKAAGARS